MEKRIVKKIDIHVHSVPFKFCPRADGSYFTTPDELRAIYDKIGVEKGVQLPTVAPEGQIQLLTCDAAYQLATEHPETYFWFCNVDPRMERNCDSTNLSYFINYYKSKGARGIGEIVANLPIDHPKMYNLFKHAQNCGMPVIFHLGRQDYDYGMIDEVGLPRLEKALRDFPDLTFLGHSQKFWAEISGDCTEAVRNGYPKGKVVPGGRIPELMRKYPNLCGDMSAGSGCNAFMRDPEFAYGFMEEFQDRLFYGTDICAPENINNPMLLLSSFLDEAMEKEYISYEAYYKISRGNALKLLGEAKTNLPE